VPQARGGDSTKILKRSLKTAFAAVDRGIEGFPTRASFLPDPGKRTMKLTRNLFALTLCSALVVAGCVRSSKSSNALSPSVAGPIPGVGITAPEPLSPDQGANISVETQPISLVFASATSNGVRPLSYSFELAADSSFTNKLFVQEGLQAGPDGRTTLRLPDRLSPERSYYWRAKADDGANAGPYSHVMTFTVFTPIVIGKPQPRSPGGQLDETTPTFVIGNAPRSGPAGTVSYVIELSETDTFATKVAVWVIPKTPTRRCCGRRSSCPTTRSCSGGRTHPTRTCRGHGPTFCRSRLLSLHHRRRRHRAEAEAAAVRAGLHAGLRSRTASSASCSATGANILRG
jgi:hypothetical protein